MRFVYVRDLDWYLSFAVEHRRDVIERPIVDDLDCSGWDVRKALHLFMRTNGALLEWLHSPIRYVEPTALCYHYHHMARGNARGYLFTDEVRLKKYFYVLRPLLAILKPGESGGSVDDCLHLLPSRRLTSIRTPPRTSAGGPLGPSPRSSWSRPVPTRA